MSTASNGTHVAAGDRFSESNLCPICGGHPRLRRGQGERCNGFYAPDRSACFCSREEHGGSPAGTDLFRHWLMGPCDCGVDHRDPMDRPTPKPRRKTKPAGKPVCELVFDWTDRHGELLFQTVRREFRDNSKAITQRRPIPDRPGMFVWSIDAVPRPLPLYNLITILEKGDPDEPLLIVEGEKHVDRLLELGFLATTSAMGAGKAEHSDWSPTKGLDVVLIPDNDDLGHKHKREVAELCRAAGAARVRWLELPGLGPKGDVLNWLDDGGTREDLRALIEAAPEAHSVNSVNSVQGPEWPPFRLKAEVSAPPFPVDVFPMKARRFCTQVAEAVLAPLDFVGGAMLATAAAAIGQSVNLKIKGGWNEPPILYLFLVAPPGRAKSPILRAVNRPLSEIDRRLRSEAKAAREQWESAKKKHDRDPKGTSPVGPEPLQRRAIVKDCTRESLALVLRDNPRGVLSDPDEATAWISSFNEYKGRGGSDRQFWLSAWSSAPVSVDRKGGRESLYVAFPFVSVVAGMPPTMLRDLVDESGRSDGLVERVLFIFPYENDFPRQEWTDKEISEGDARGWSEIVGRLFATEMVYEADGLRPFFVSFTPEGRAEWTAWFNRHCAEMEADDFPSRLEGAWSKMRSYCARFALVLSRVRWACDHPDDFGGDPRPYNVDSCDVQGAIELTEYFKAHFARATSAMTGAVENLEAAPMLKWLRKARLTEFTERDLYRALPRYRSDADAMREGLLWLSERGVIRPKARPPSSGPGRKASPTWEVNPRLADTIDRIDGMEPRS